jgi:formylglycine-generating enzyme required for sulfatase activity
MQSYHFNVHVLRPILAMIALWFGPICDAQVQRVYRVASSTNCAISSLSRTGILTWTNASAVGAYTIERSDSLAQQDWIPLIRGPVTNFVMSVRVHHSAPPDGMVFIPGGVFTMGDVLGDLKGISTPIHTAHVDPFFLGKFEMSNEAVTRILQWAFDRGKIRVTSNSVENVEGVARTLLSLSKHNSEISFDQGLFRIRPGRQRHPCVWINWYGSAAFCNYLSELEGKEVTFNLTTWVCDFTKKGYRLPTETEWELAARGGWEGKRFPWGGDNLISHTLANYRSSTNNAYDVSVTRDYHPIYGTASPKTNPVDAFTPNPFGLYDMAGNSWEWVYDWSARYPSTHQINPTGPSTGTFKVFRGGSWFTTAERLTCGVRYTSATPISTFDDFGFRIVLPYQ